MTIWWIKRIPWSAKQVQSTLFNCNYGWNHIPKKILSIWRGGQRSCVDISINHIQMIYKVCLEINLFISSQKFLKKYISKRLLLWIINIKQYTHNSCNEFILILIDIIHMDNVHFQGIILIWKSMLGAIIIRRACPSISLMEMDLFWRENHLWFRWVPFRGQARFKVIWYGLAVVCLEGI